MPVLADVAAPMPVLAPARDGCHRPTPRSLEAISPKATSQPGNLDGGSRAMFEGLAEAREALDEYFAPAVIEIVVGAMVPALVFDPLDDRHVAVGATKLGGLPDLAMGTPWPRPQAPQDAEEIAGRGNEEAGKMIRAHLALGLPLAFIGQVDLSQVPDIGLETADLPGEGRLLFFYDLVVGPWETGNRPARVVWDRTPREALAPTTMPSDLAAAADDYRREMAGIHARFPTASGTRPEEGTNFGAAERAMALKPALRLPHPNSLDMTFLTGPDGLRFGEESGAEAAELSDLYDEVIEAYQDYYPAETGKRQQFLGSPLPEQDDPRYDAVVVSRFGRQHLTREEWQQNRATIEAEAREWRLLLQVDLGDWMQAALVEGTVYFLIRRADLRERRFDRVIAVYQQT